MKSLCRPGWCSYIWKFVPTKPRNPETELGPSEFSQPTLQPSQLPISLNTFLTAGDCASLGSRSGMIPECILCAPQRARQGRASTNEHMPGSGLGCSLLWCLGKHESLSLLQDLEIKLEFDGTGQRKGLLPGKDRASKGQFSCCVEDRELHCMAGAVGKGQVCPGGSQLL